MFKCYSDVSGVELEQGEAQEVRIAEPKSGMVVAINFHYDELPETFKTVILAKIKEVQDKRGTPNPAGEITPDPDQGKYEDTPEEV